MADKVEDGPEFEANYPALKPGERRKLKLEATAIACSEEEAATVGKLGYLASLLVQTTLPHQNPDDEVNVYRRTNRQWTMTVTGDEGIPWGAAPRLKQAYLCTQMVLRQSPVVPLGRSRNEFCALLGMRQDGHNGARITQQANRLFNVLISIKHEQASSAAADGCVGARTSSSPTAPCSASCF